MFEDTFFEIFNESCLIKEIEYLYNLMDDNFSEDNIDLFNHSLNDLLQEYEVTLERYHEILEEDIERTIEEGD
jgi:hypothetical protein